MANPTPQVTDPCTSLDGFLLMVKRFAEHPALQSAESFTTDFKQLTAKVKVQEETMMETTDKLLRTEQELERSNERWKTEHPERIGEILRSHREETHKVIETRDKLQTELDRLKVEATERTSTISVLEGKIEDLQHQLEEEKKNTKALQDQIVSLQQGNAKLETDLSRANESLRARDDQIKEHNARFKDQEKSTLDLVKKTAGLEEKVHEQAALVKQFLVFAPRSLADKIPDISQHMKNLWQQYHKLISECFGKDVATSVLEDQQFCRTFRETGAIPSGVQLPPSNTVAAKRIRTAAVMAVLAESLVQHIFTPTYLFFEDEEYRDILFHLATIEADKGRFLKRVVNSTCEDKQAAVKKRRIDSVLERVISCVYQLLDEDTRDTFQTRLSQLLVEATDLWSEVQRRRSYIDSDIAIDPTGQWTWLSVGWTGQMNDLQEHQTTSERLNDLDTCMVLFPRVFIVTDSIDQPVFPGTVLSQSDVRAAKKEWDKIRQSNPSLGRSLTSQSMRSRRLTLTQQNGNGQSFLGLNKS